MKKREITRIVHSLMVAGLAACLLAGCGNAKTESSSDTAVEETTDAEAATESEEAENEAAEEQSGANAETLVEENSSTETTDTDTTDSSDEEEETESDTTTEATDTASSDPGEVTYITDFTSIDDYMGGFDMSTSPVIVIYNEQEGYLINMQEGQHYQLDSNDVILCNIKKTDNESDYDIAFRVDLETEEVVFPNYHMMIPDYTKWTQEEEFYNIVYDKEGNELGGVTCYLTPADVYLNSPAGE